MSSVRINAGFSSNYTALMKCVHYFDLEIILVHILDQSVRVLSEGDADVY
jgi:hypothetical protein